MVVPVLIFGIVNLGCVAISKEKYGVTLPLTLMISSFIVYASQWAFSSFRPGYLIIVAMAIFSLILTIVKRNDKTFQSDIKSSGLLTYLMVCLVFLFIDLGRYVTSWDEVMTWSKMVKEMMRIDSFYSAETSLFWGHKEYPPIVPIFEMIWCKFSGGFSESGETMALHVLMLSFISPWMVDTLRFKSDNFKTKIIVSLSTILIAVTVLINIDGEGIFSTLYLDMLLAVVFAFSLALVFFRKNMNQSFNAITLIVTLSFLVMIKQIGFIFAGLSWMYYAYDVLKEHIDFRKANQETNGDDKSRQRLSTWGGVLPFIANRC